MGALSAIMSIVTFIQQEKARKAAEKAAKKQEEALARQEAIGPLAKPEVEGEDIQKRFAKRKGRKKTIVTGDLTPATIGKSTLLG